MIEINIPALENLSKKSLQLLQTIISTQLSAYADDVEKTNPLSSETGSIITGEAGDNIGRGVSSEVYLVAPLKSPAGLYAGVDVDDLAWDGRIHSRTGSKTKDGRWRMIKKLDKTVQASSSILPPPPSISVGYKSEIPAPVIPELEFATVSDAVVNAMFAGTVTKTQVLDYFKTLGVPDLPTLASRPDLFETVYNHYRVKKS